MNTEHFYPRKALVTDIYELIDIQVNHSEPVLSVKSRYSEGFLDYVLSRRALDACIRLGLLHVAVKGETSKVKAFACGIPISIGKHIGILQETFTDIIPLARYPIFLQVCVKKESRKEGLARALVNNVLEEAQRQTFTHAIAPVSSKNLLAAEFFYQCGFSIFKAPLIPNTSFFYKTLQK